LLVVRGVSIRAWLPVAVSFAFKAVSSVGFEPVLLGLGLQHAVLVELVNGMGAIVDVCAARRHLLAIDKFQVRP